MSIEEAKFRKPVMPGDVVHNGVLDRLFVALQAHQLIHINVECLGLDSTSIKEHPDGTGALKKTVRNQSVNLEVSGQQKFIWLPRMIDAP